MSVNRDNVRVIRLLTGEEVIGEVVASEKKSFLTESAAYALEKKPELDMSGDIVLRNPCLLVMRAEDKGKINIGLIPWLIYKKGDSITIRTGSIISVVEVDAGLVNKYAANFSSITLPDTGLITR